MLEYTQRITLELSNQCNLAKLHSKCPAHHVKVIEALSTRVVRDVLSWAGSLGYCGGFAFHIYNEPMMDPRFYSFCEGVKQLCPSSKGVLLWTNGAYLNQESLDKIKATGTVHTIRCSLYSTMEKCRLEKLAFENPDVNFVFSWEIQQFDDRLNKNEISPTEKIQAPYTPCYAPLVDLTINHAGKLVLCCMDWDASVTFGDLNVHSMQEVMRDVNQRMKLTQYYDRLKAGLRDLHMCKSCAFPRTMDPNMPIGRTL